MSNRSLDRASLFLLYITLIFSLIWILASFSAEAVVTLLTAIAGIAASSSGSQKWGRAALVIAAIVALIWVRTSLNWSSIATLLTSAIGAISSFSDEESRDSFSATTIGRGASPTTTFRATLTLLALVSWVLVWYVCLYWGFEWYIPGLLLDITDLAAPLPQSWLLDNTVGFLICFILSGLIVVLPFDWHTSESVVGAGFLAGIVSIVVAWVSYLVYVAHGWNLGELFTSLMVMILAHMLLVGFVASIGMAIFGIGVTIIWIGIMLLVRWVAIGMQRFLTLGTT